MVSVLIEKELISKLIYEPELIKICRAHDKWFRDRNHRDILDVLIENYGKGITPNELYERVKLKRPDTMLTAEVIEDLRIDGMMAGDMDALTDQLERNYLHNNMMQASRMYADYSSEENFQKMQDAMRELESLEQNEDSGKLEDVTEKIRHQLYNDAGEGIKTYDLLDKALGGGLYGGELAIVGARPGVGKTAYGINLAIQAMSRNDEPVVDFFTLEMTQESMLKRFISRTSEINSMRLRNPYKNLSDAEKLLVEEKSREFLGTHLRIYDDKYNLKDIEIEIRRRHHEADGKPYLPIIDYLQLIDVEGRSENQNVEVGKITRALKLLTNELDIPIIVLSQLNREMEAHERPSLKNLRDSGNIEQDASLVLFLFNEVDEIADSGYGQTQKEPTNRVICYIAKNRHGIPGDLFYRFLKSKMYFQELDE